jgi:hypothetical protein
MQLWSTHTTIETFVPGAALNIGFLSERLAKSCHRLAYQE